MRIRTTSGRLTGYGIFALIWTALGVFFLIILRSGGPIMWGLVAGVTIGGWLAAVRGVARRDETYEGTGRCAYCKRNLKYAGGHFATVCTRCGREQPGGDAFSRGLKTSGILFQDSEHGIYTGPVVQGNLSGQLVLSNRRLHFTQRGKSGVTREWPLDGIDQVIRFTNAPGFAIDMTSGVRVEFRTSPASEWYERTLTAANAPQVNAMRNQRWAPASSTGPAGSPQLAEPQSRASSVADELGKLGDLRDRGLLTDVEFEQEKARLLGAGPDYQ